MRGGNVGAERVTRLCNGFRINQQHLVADERFARQQHGFGHECRVKRWICKRITNRLYHRLMIGFA